MKTRILGWQYDLFDRYIYEADKNISASPLFDGLYAMFDMHESRMEASWWTDTTQGIKAQVA